MQKKMSFTQKLKLSFFSFLLFCFAITASAQHYLNFVDRIYFQAQDSLNQSSGVWCSKVVVADTLKNGMSLEAFPIVAYGINRVSGKRVSPVYHAGGLVSFFANAKQFSVRAAAELAYSKPFENLSSSIDSFKIVPNETRYYSKYNGQRYAYFKPQVVAEYAAKKFFNFSLGYAKNFIGDGYRSVIVSDNSIPVWFAKIQTKFWRFKYTNLWMSPSSSFVNPVTGLEENATRKFIAAHYLTYAVNKKFSISFYEAVVWKGKDTLNNRGFDINYLNPVVFYRPIEFSTGSSDNSLIALSAKWKILKAATLYGQFLIDEFLVSAVKQDILKQFGQSTNGQWGWWANKQAAQIGLKLAPLKGVLNGLQLLAEYNLVRPFTFTHTSVVQSYTNHGQSLALPSGANCTEYVALIAYRKSRLQLLLKANMLKQGLDNDSVNNGQSILRTSTTRNKDYENELYQGEPFEQTQLAARIDYSWKKQTSLSYFAEGYYRKAMWNNTSIEQQVGLVLGICWKGWLQQLDY